MFSTCWRMAAKRRCKVPTRNSLHAPTRSHFDLECLEERSLLSRVAFDVTNLVSDQPGVALIQDTDLVNPWGIALPPSGPFWVSDNGTGKATIYSGDVNGSPFVKNSLVVTIPGGVPTGQVFNGTGDFVVHSGTSSGSAIFIFASESGLITGWNFNVPPPPPSTEAQIGTTAADAVYKGLTLANNGTENLIYAANFSQHRIDVFDTNFNPVTLSGSFQDRKVPDGYAPFNIQNLDGKLYVTYAKPDAEGADDVPGQGHGFVAVFDTNGNLIRHLVSHGQLDSPWGLALAPAHFGRFSNALLVGNFGDGQIHAYDADSGNFIGQLRGPDHKPIQIDGLWALRVGNGVTAGDTNAVYFTAGPDEESHGLFGKITVASDDSSAESVVHSARHRQH